MRFMLVLVGGGLGAVLRYVVDGWVAGRFGIAFPYGTFLINRHPGRQRGSGSAQYRRVHGLALFSRREIISDQATSERSADLRGNPQAAPERLWTRPSSGGEACASG